MFITPYQLLNNGKAKSQGFADLERKGSFFVHPDSELNLCPMILLTALRRDPKSSCCCSSVTRKFEKECKIQTCLDDNEFISSKSCLFTSILLFDAFPPQEWVDRQHRKIELLSHSYTKSWIRFLLGFENCDRESFEPNHILFFSSNFFSIWTSCTGISK